MHLIPTKQWRLAAWGGQPGLPRWRWGTTAPVGAGFVLCIQTILHTTRLQALVSHHPQGSFGGLCKCFIGNALRIGGDCPLVLRLMLEMPPPVDTDS